MNILIPPEAQAMLDKPDDVLLLVGFSGGKDSQATLHEIHTRYGATHNIEVIYADTGWEYETEEGQWLSTLDWNIEQVARYGYKLHYVRNEKETYPQRVRRRGMFPDARNRFCTSDFKTGPIHKWINQRPEPIIIDIQGKRAAESPARKKLPPWQYNAAASAPRRSKLTGKPRMVYTWLPIHPWPTEYMYTYAKEKGYALHPAYKFLGRFSCQICIFASAKDLAQTRRYNPRAFNEIADIEREIGFTMKSKGTVREWADRWDAGQLKDEPQSQQMCMF